MTQYLDFLLPAQELSPKLAEVHWGSQEAQEALRQLQLVHLLEMLGTFLEPRQDKLVAQVMQAPLAQQQLRGLVELVALVVD